MKRIAGIIVCTLSLVACFAAVGCAGETGSLGNAITVSATATAQVAPDKGTITISASAEGDSSKDAKAASEKVQREIVDALKGAGVAEDAVKLGSVSVNEEEVAGTGEIIDGYEDEWGNWIDIYSDWRMTYVASGKITVSSFAADRLAEVVRAAAGAGATGFSDLSFSISDRNVAYQQGLNAAVEAAHAKAEALAKSAGVYVGRVVNLVEGETTEFEVTVKDDASLLDPARDETLNVTPSKIPVEASVSVSYAIS